MMKIEKGNTKVCLCQETSGGDCRKGSDPLGMDRRLSAGTALQRRKLFIFWMQKTSPMKPIRWAWEPESGAASKDLKKTA